MDGARDGGKTCVQNIEINFISNYSDQLKHKLFATSGHEIPLFKARSREITSHIWMGLSRTSGNLLFYTVNKILDLFIHTADYVILGVQVQRNLIIRLLSNMTNNGLLEHASHCTMFYDFSEENV